MPAVPPHRHHATRTLAARTLAGTVALGACLLPVLLAAPATAADDLPDVTWGVRTASGDLGADRQSYAYTAAPGDRLTDAIVVTNHDDAPIELDLYAADGFTTDAGQLDVLARGEESVGVGAWVETATDHVTVPPGESLQVDLALTVPEDAEPGDHAGAVVTSLTVPQEETGVTVDRRLGIRVHLRVTGDLAPGLVVDGLRVEHTGALSPFAPGGAVVTYSVRNSGNVRLQAAQDVTVGGPFGAATVHATDLADVPELLPGETWAVSTPVEGVWPLLRATATVTLDPRLPDDAESAPAVTAVRAAATTWAVPWSALAVLAAAAAAAVGWRRARARRRRAEDARVQTAVQAALDERDGRSRAADPAATVDA